MAIDANGKDLTKVGVALTGNAAIMGYDAEFAAPINTAFGAAAYTLPVSFDPLGLRTEDGAPEWTDEPDGDALEFYEDGYSIPSGLVTAECKMILAQSEPLVMELKSGVTLDANGVAQIDLGGNAKRYILFTEDVLKTPGGGSLIERRMAAVTVKSVVSQKPERGTVRGYEVTFSVHRDAKFGDKHMLYALIDPAAAGAGG